MSVLEQTKSVLVQLEIAILKWLPTAFCHSELVSESIQSGISRRLWDRPWNKFRVTFSFFFRFKTDIKRQLRTRLTRARTTDWPIGQLGSSILHDTADKKDSNKSHCLFYGASNGLNFEPYCVKLAHHLLNDECTINTIKMLL